jgi:hypothetical protein
MTDLVVLIATRPSADLIDVERKIIAAMLVGDVDGDTPLDAAVRAAMPGLRPTSYNRPYPL